MEKKEAAEEMEFINLTLIKSWEVELIWSPLVVNAGDTDRTSEIPSG